MDRPSIALVCACVALAAPVAGWQPSNAASAVAHQSPRAVLDGLLAAERGLSDAAATLSPAQGLASLIADDGVLVTRTGPVTGRAAAMKSLSDNPANKGAHARWRSIRGGISADGQQGFTLGYVDIEGAVPATARRRYLAYWVRGSDGWRVAALKQVLRSANETDAPQQAAALPAALVPPDPARTAEHRRTLIAAEKAFSDRAQTVGIKQSFQEYGRPDAIHLFGPTGFAIGLPAIGANHDQQPAGPATSHWSADTAVVASSGDLGVTIGTIRSNGPPPEGQPAEVPFFTIWRRDNPSQPWRYIAE